METSVALRKAENTNLIRLGEHFRKVFPPSGIDSHNFEHHLRVWNYAKELLFYTESGIAVADEYFCNSLLIACLLHDSGMAIDYGTKHGAHSAKICKDFLLYNSLHIEDYSEMLEAVEKHDDKEYRQQHNDNKILRILAVADDLDAFGYTGIYRYLEIYLKRGTDPSETGKMILKNARVRFGNLYSVYSRNSQFIAKHKPRYEILTGFFEKYNNQSDSYKFGSETPSGECGIADFVLEHLRLGTTLEELIGKGTKIPGQPVISDFFIHLNREIHQTSHEQSNS